MNQITIRTILLFCFAVVSTFAWRGAVLIPNSKGCWLKCGKKGGSCPTVCGKDGFCCRKGYDDCPEDYANLVPFDKHACVHVIGNPEYPYSDYKDKGCSKKGYTKIGCVNTKEYLIRGQLLVYWRKDIEWASDRLSSFASSFICACAEAAKKVNVPYFGTHFWGECWALTQAQVVNAPDGDCVAADGTYKTHCDRPADSQHECLAVKSYYMYAVAEVSVGVPTTSQYRPPPLPTVRAPPVPQTCKALKLMRIGGNSRKGNKIRRKNSIKTIKKLPGNYRIKFGFRIKSLRTGRRNTQIIFMAREKGGRNNVNTIPTVYIRNRKINIAFYNDAGKFVIARVRKVPIKKRKWYRVIMRKNRNTLRVSVELLHTTKKWTFKLKNQPAVSYRKVVIQPYTIFRLNGWIRKIQISGSCPK